MGSKLFLAAVLSFVALAGCSQQAGGPVNDGQVPETGNGPVESGDFVVVRTSNGYEPGEITIVRGSTVTFVNDSQGEHWPASAQHPTHTVYPGSGIAKCGTAEDASIFDACRGFLPEESYSFTFNEVGSWFYHDHLDPTTFGKIIVVGQ